MKQIGAEHVEIEVNVRVYEIKILREEGVDSNQLCHASQGDWPAPYLTRPMRATSLEFFRVG